MELPFHMQVSTSYELIYFCCYNSDTLFAMPVLYHSFVEMMMPKSEPANYYVLSLTEKQNRTVCTTALHFGFWFWFWFWFWFGFSGYTPYTM